MEFVVGPFLPEPRAILVDLSLRFRMKREFGSNVTDQGLRRQALRFRQSMMDAVTPPFVRVEHVRVAGRWAEWVEASDAPEKVILYFHGGGFFMSSPTEHRPLTWRMARATKRRVLALDYRKAPDYAFPSWVEDGAAAYADLLARGVRPADVILAGDSAGGNIALAVTNRIRKEKLAMPEGLVLFSPWADLECTGRSYRTNARRDAMFDADGVRAMGKYLTRACDVRDPEVSPIHSDFRGFPRMLLIAASTEVFLDDARTVMRRARDAGVDAELYVHRHLPHVFPMFSGLIPRAKAAFETVTRFAARDQKVPAPTPSPSARVIEIPTRK